MKNVGKAKEFYFVISVSFKKVVNLICDKCWKKGQIEGNCLDCNGTGYLKFQSVNR